MVLEDGKYYPVIKAEFGEMYYDREIFYHYGKLLLEGKHPVLREYLEQRKEICRKICEKLNRDGRQEERTRARIREIEEEMQQIDAALACYDEM